MSSAEQPGTSKRSAHFGPARTRIKALDDGVRKTIQNAIQRWQEKRIEFIEGLPERTQQELQEEGMLSAPVISLPGAQTPAQAQPRREHAPAPRMTVQPAAPVQARTPRI